MFHVKRPDEPAGSVYGRAMRARILRACPRDTGRGGKSRAHGVRPYMWGLRPFHMKQWL